MKDNSLEKFPIVDEEGHVIGSATRGECHSGKKLGKWDTSVGGHIDYGEEPEQALVREVREELGITEFTPVRVGKYVFESKREKELVYVHRTTYDGPVTPSAEELDGGRFWTLDEIREAIGKEVLTPNFESEFQKFFL